MQTKSHLGTLGLLILFTAPAFAETPAPTEGPTAAALPTVTPRAYRRLTGRLVTRVVRQHRRSIGRCYNRSLKRDQRLSGRLDMLVTVKPDGHVKAVQLATKQFAGSPLATCIERSISAWRFPAFAGDAAQDVLLPFSLRPPKARAKIASR